MAEEDKKKTEEEEFEIVEEGAENSSTNSADDASKKTVVEDDRLRQDDDDDDDSEDKEGETPEQRTARRREERRKRKERQKRAEQDNKNLVIELRKQNELLEKRLGSIETHALGREARDVDQRMTAAQQRYEYAEQAMAEATAKGDGKGLVLATRAKDEAAAAYNTAKQIKERLSSLGGEEKETKPAPRQKGPDPEVAKKAKAFVTRHSWIDPNGQADEDSAIARTIDVRLQSEGFDPRDDDYWDELEKRLKTRLPHKFQADTKRKEPPLNSGGDRSAGGKRTFVLSKARKDALIESGDWDDPARRQKMIKKYAEYDAAHKTK